MPTWQEDIAATARYKEPYRRARNCIDLREVDDFTTTWDMDCDGPYETCIDSETRLVMRAKHLPDFEEAKAIVDARRKAMPLQHICVSTGGNIRDEWCIIDHTTGLPRESRW